VSLSGRQRTVYSALGSLSICDISSTGRVMMEHALLRNGIRIKGPGDKSERDLSWLHSSDVADISVDGEAVLILELREGDGPGGAYIRDADGSEAVRLGDGDPLALSPDSRWALVRSFDERPELVLLPTGAGEPRRLPYQGVQADWALFMRNGSQLLVGGVDDGQRFGCYLQEIDTGVLKRLPWDVPSEAFAVISPGGDRVALGPMEGRIDLFSITGGLVHTLPGFQSRETLIQWSQDGRYLFSADLTCVPAKIYKVDADTGQRSLWKELAPVGVSEGVKIRYVSITPDGRSYAYSFAQVLASDLYLMDGWE
jgi:hypothetical protein